MNNFDDVDLAIYGVPLFDVKAEKHELCRWVQSDGQLSYNKLGA